MRKDKRARIVMHFLANLPTMTQLHDLKEWRCAKYLYLKKIEQKEFDHMTEYFRRRIISGYEVELLRDILARMSRKHIKAALDYFTDLKDKNDRIKEHNKKSQPSKSKELLIIPGLEGQVEALILTLYFLLRHLCPLFGAPPPIRFAKEQLAVAAKQDWKAFSRSFKEERIFYGRFLSFSRRIGALVTASGDEQAYVDALVSDDARRQKDFFSILGAAAISMLAAGYVGYSLAPGSAWPQGVLTPRPDAIHEVIQAYREFDLLQESESERRLEQRYGFNIIGDFTDEDLNEIEHVLATRYNQERLYDLGLRTIIIISGEYSDRVDYAGQARFGEGAIRLFSGNINDTGIFEHELAHIQANHYGRRDANFWKGWDHIAGPYNRVVFSRGAEAWGGVAFVQHYVDGSDIELPRFGYARAYGGGDHQEDIGTMIEKIKTNPEHFANVNGDFDAYLQKFEFLEHYGFITHGEHERVRRIVETARMTVRPAQ